MFLKRMVPLVLCLLVVACGSDMEPVGSGFNYDGDDDIQTKSSESWSYHFIYNGCDTDKHTFASKQAMCDGLKDDSLNNYCAYSLRKEYFQQKSCAGSFL
ncbi:hypothetical protein GW915_05560 [bacterium]|nr:hypothetical protein [bacterium]